MKIKILFTFILIAIFSVSGFAQAQNTSEKKDAPAKVSTTDQHSAKADCKWVDANKDGICDICGKKDCGSKPAATMSKGCDPANCSYHKEGTKAEGCPSKSGKKKK